MLREWSEDDLATIVELFEAPDIAYRTPLPAPFDLHAAHEYLDRVRQTRFEGHQIHLAITTDGRHPQGEVLLNVNSRSISYVVGAAHRGQRLAARAVQVLTAYAHQELALPQVLLEIEPDNHPSIAVAQAAGFHSTDAAPEQVEDKGRSYSLLTWVHEDSRSN